MGTPKDHYRKELVPAFFNHEWTATGGMSNYYFNFNFDPYNLDFMKTNILGNKAF